MLQFARILCPIDFSDTSTRALTYATALARRYRANLEVLHAVRALGNSRHTAREADPDGASLASVAASRDRLTIEVEHVIRATDAEDLKWTPLVQEGRAHEVIACRARTLPADLLVMGTHGRSGFNRLLLGSVTEKVLRQVACPVLTVPPAAHTKMESTLAFKNILCAIDYSPSALKGLGYALELSRQADGRLTVLYALEYMDPQEPCEHVPAEIRRSRKHFLDQARQRLHAQLARESHTRCRIEETVVLDRAYKAILRCAEAAAVDLIVMGAQGAGGLELMVYGSNTQHVLRAAACPVLTVKA